MSTSGQEDFRSGDVVRLTKCLGDSSSATDEENPGDLQGVGMRCGAFVAPFDVNLVWVLWVSEKWKPARKPQSLEPLILCTVKSMT